LRFIILIYFPNMYREFGEARLKCKCKNMVVVVRIEERSAENLQRLVEDLFNRYLRLPRLRLR